MPEHLQIRGVDALCANRSRVGTLLPSLPVPHSPRYYSLDFWRGIACLMVIVYHSCMYQLELTRPVGLEKIAFIPIAYMVLGVPMFFVISGYCISATCDSLRRKPRSIGHYLYRRYHRIFPPFWICVGLSIIVLLVAEALGRGSLFYDTAQELARPGTLSAMQWLGNLSLTESWRYIVFGGSRQYFLGQAWSLCYEEQFYVICGLILFLAPTRFFRCAIIVTGGVAIAMMLSAGFGLTLNGFFFDGRWFMFTFGILVYWVVNYAPSRSRWMASIGLGFACALSILGLLIRHSRIFLLNTEGVRIVAALIFATALLVLHRFDRKITANRFLSPVTYCGVMCYSLYLVHWTIVKPISHALWLAGYRTWPATLSLTIPLCLGVSIFLSRAFHVFVERRFLNTPGPLLTGSRRSHGSPSRLAESQNGSILLR